MSNNSNLMQWLKAVFFVGILLVAQLSFAADSVGIPDLDKQATGATALIKFVAKWGGMAVVILSGILIASGKAKGETATVLASVAIGIGVIASAWAWYKDSVSGVSGFAW